MSGGVAPGGSCLSCVCETAVICALAMRISTFGWKNTLMMPRPLYEVASICSMSLTVVVSPRWAWVRNAAGHQIRLQAGVLPDDGDHRDPDVRKDIDGRSQGSERTDDEDDQGEDDEGIGAPQGDADDGNHAVGAPSVFIGACPSTAASRRERRVALHKMGISSC
jgi:hypothetical protein